MADNSLTPLLVVAAAMIGACIGVRCTAGAGNIKPESPESRPERPASVRALVTAYCPCVKCCGKFADGKTSRGRDAWRTRGVAVDPKRIPYGSKITIPGAGTFIADDTGGAMRSARELHIDLRFHSHQQALRWGKKRLNVVIRQ